MFNDHALFKDNNAKVHYYLEEAAQSTQHGSLIKSYQIKKNGRDDWLPLVGNTHWRGEMGAIDQEGRLFFSHLPLERAK